MLTRRAATTGDIAKDANDSLDNNNDDHNIGNDGNWTTLQTAINRTWWQRYGDVDDAKGHQKRTTPMTTDNTHDMVMRMIATTQDSGDGYIRMK